MADHRHLKVVFGPNSAADCLISVKFCIGKQNSMAIEVTRQTLNFENSRWRTPTILQIIESLYLNEQVALLSQRGRVMLRVCVTVEIFDSLI